MANAATATDVIQVNARELAERWWTVLLRGVAAMVFGVLTFLNPGMSLFALVLLFGAYALVDGAFNLVMAVKSARGGRRWGALVFAGIAGIAAGALTFLWPGITAIVLLLFISAWAIVTGIAYVVAAIRLRKQIRHEWLLGLAGILSVAFGVLMVLFPGAGALAVILWIGAYALVTGALLIALAFRLRAWGRTPEQRLPTGGEPLPA